MQALQMAQKKLQQSGAKSPYLDAIILLKKVTSFSKEQIIFNENFLLSQKQQQDFFSAIERRANREPVSHIIEHREFYGFDFFVNSKVLDPRPDSESLIELVLQIFSDKNQQLKILELGVGSACLTISLLKNLTNAKAIGAEISDDAILVAQKNIKNHNLSNRFSLVKSDLFQNIEAQKFDLIISNPPYIKTCEIDNLEDEVRLFEPILALDGGVDGLDFYRNIAKETALFLKPQGLVALELGHDQKNAVVEIFAKNNFKLKAQKQDLSGFDRAVCFGF